jgi:hypothetical protein
MKEIFSVMIVDKNLSQRVTLKIMQKDIVILSLLYAPIAGLSFIEPRNLKNIRKIKCCVFKEEIKRINLIAQKFMKRKI